MSWLAGLAALLLLVPAAARAEGGRVAIVVGANAGDPQDVVLRHAETDADRLAAALRLVGEFAPDEVIILKGIRADDLRRTIIRVNARLAESAAGEGLLLVFYSGHADSDALHLGGTRLPLAELRDLVKGSPARGRLLIVDACRSGALTRIKGVRAVPNFDVAIEAPAGPRGFAILTSTAASEDAQESDRLQASFFSHFLLSALFGAADQNRDERVTLSEAFAYVSRETVAATVTTAAGPQHPTYHIDLGGRDDVVLSRPGVRRDGVGHLFFPRPGRYVVERQGEAGLAADLREVAATQPGGRLAARPGRYQVTLRAPDHMLQGSFVVASGANTEVATAGMARTDYARLVRKGSSELRLARSLFATVGARTAMLDLGLTSAAGVGFRLDGAAASGEVRLGVESAGQANRRNTIDTRGLSLSLAVVRAADLGLMTVAFGTEVGALALRQSYSDPAAGPALSLAGVLAPLVQLEARVGARWYLRLEGAVPVVLASVAGNEGPRAVVTGRLGLGAGGYF